MAEEKKGGKKVGILALAAIVIVGGALACKSCNKDKGTETDEQKIETAVEPNATQEQTPAPESAPTDATEIPTTESAPTEPAQTPAPESAPTDATETPEA